MRVLIADDSDILAERLATALKKVSGIEIVGRAWTAAGASESIWRLKPDVVILDLCMPGGSGISVLENLQRDIATPVVIVLTNYGQSQYRKRCLAKGASYFFDKSVEFEKVVEIVRNLAQAPEAARKGNAKQPVEENPAAEAGPGPSPAEWPAVAERPRLLVSTSQKGEPIYYMCSLCLQGFMLDDDKPPRRAVTELYERFRVHVTEKHPEPNGAETKRAA